MLGEIMGIARLKLDESHQVEVDGLVKEGQRLLPTLGKGQPSAEVDTYLARCKEVIKAAEAGGSTSQI